MPSGVSDYGADYWLEVLFGVTDPPAHYWIALCSDAPGPGSDGDIVASLEPNEAGSNYQRQEYGTGGTDWATNGGFITNLIDIDWPLPFTDWGRITHYALLDASTSGNLYAWGEMNNPQYVSQAFLLTIPAGGLIVSLSAVENPITF